MKMEKQDRLFPIFRYCIDTSTLIYLTRYPGYPREIFPAIWEKLESIVKGDELISHIDVYKEIEKRKDTIYQWCKQNKKMFKDIDNYQTQKFHQIEGKYDFVYWKTKMKKDESWADPLLIALSICEKTNKAPIIIVTDEKNAENHIPYIANYFNIQCLNLIDFFKKIGIKFN